MDSNYKKRIVLDMDVESVTATDPNFGNGQTIVWIQNWEQIQHDPPPPPHQ